MNLSFTWSAIKQWESNNQQTQWLLIYRISLSRPSAYTWTRTALIGARHELEGCALMFKTKKRARPFSSLQFVVARHVVSLSHVSDRWQRSTSRSSLCLASFSSSIRENRWSFHSTIPLAHGMIWNMELSLHTHQCRKRLVSHWLSVLNCTCRTINLSKCRITPSLFSRSTFLS